MKQAAAQAHGWSLEEIEICVTVRGAKSKVDRASFVVSGLSLESATWAESRLAPVDADGSLRTALPPVLFECVLKRDAPQAPPDAAASYYVPMPLYLNCDRTEVLATLRLPSSKSISPEMWAQSGAAIIL